MPDFNKDFEDLQVTNLKNEISGLQEYMNSLIASNKKTKASAEPEEKPRAKAAVTIKEPASLGFSEEKRVCASNPDELQAVAAHQDLGYKSYAALYS